MQLSLDIIQTLGVAIIALTLGGTIKAKSDLLKKFFIPSPVIGGLIISFLVFILKKTSNFSIEFDQVLQDFFMNIFFTSIGLASSFKALKKSGLLGLKLTLAIIILLPLQTLLAIGLSKVFAINPLYGVAMGSTSMTGGIGSAISFGKIMEARGAANAIEIGVAASTFGLLVGSLVGGPVARRLIRKNKLVSEDLLVEKTKQKSQITEQGLIKAIVIIGLAALLGTLINKILALTSLNFPYYVGCQFGGLIVRNILDYKKGPVDMINISTVGNISLKLFLSLALIGLNIAAIITLALPMLVVMLAQAIFIAIYTSLVTFNLAGRTYNAAVIVAGHCGVGLGQTPNAIANMEAIIEKEGPADLAMFVLPLVLAIAVNLANPLVITFFINIV